MPSELQSSSVKQINQQTRSTYRLTEALKQLKKKQGLRGKPNDKAHLNSVQGRNSTTANATQTNLSFASRH